MRAINAMRLAVPLAVVLGTELLLPASAQGQSAETHAITCEIDFFQLPDGDLQQIPAAFRQSYLTPAKPELGDFAEKKCTFSAPNQTIQIRCLRVIEGWANAPNLSVKNFRSPCTISGVPECGVPQVYLADNQTFKLSPDPSNPTRAVAELFCVRNKR